MTSITPVQTKCSHSPVEQFSHEYAIINFFKRLQVVLIGVNRESGMIITVGEKHTCFMKNIGLYSLPYGSCAGY